MTLNRRIVTAATTTLAVTASLGLASVASAKDRNHDRIPDRWEHAHRLSLHVNHARRDQDHDGLNNRGEFRAHFNPRKADTDGDGIMDGEENAGTIASFDNGTLTINLAGGGTLTGMVTQDTEIECPDTAQASDDGGGDHQGGGDDGDGDHQGGGDDGDGDHQGGGDDDQGDDDGGNCDATALTDGATVHEAELKATNGQAIFEKVELGS
jgi:hypothetical protein